MLSSAATSTNPKKQVFYVWILKVPGPFALGGRAEQGIIISTWLPVFFVISHSFSFYRSYRSLVEPDDCAIATS
ncbi:unnamed protein product [Amoebophrya sp. A120]|nr:unnamed protein product [Amoebophrya sp. A120]|eukprot:GSA120T00012447001.1